jgi:thiamine-monophosphate kinase
MIDLSDGLARDLGHLCRLSGVGAVVEVERLVIDDELARAAVALKRDPLAWVLGGGEDYELLFTSVTTNEPQLAERMAKAGCGLIRVGELVREPGLFLAGKDGKRRPLAQLGFDHFAAAGQG